MNQFYRFHKLPLLFITLLLGALHAALAQTTMLPVPFVTAIAGQPAGSTNTACTTSIPNAGGQSLGDGCLPTQATFASMQDIQVDPEGNIYISEQTATLGTLVTGSDIRVIYKGGAALTAALTAANSGIANFTPIPGRVYTLVGGLTGVIGAVSGVYHCGAIVTNNVAIDTLGNGCPAAQIRTVPRGFAVDQYGNLVFTNVTGKFGLRVMYAGGTQMANLITLLNPNVATPQVGYVYQLGLNGPVGAGGDGGIATNAGVIQPRYVAIDLGGNVYFSDGAPTSTVGGATISASPDNVRMINGTTGIITTVAGENTCGQSAYNSATGCPYGSSGDGGPATSALFLYPHVIFLDQNNNLFISDQVNARLRVLYRGGTLAGIANPVVGNIYTYAGGGTLAVDGTPAPQVKFSAMQNAGIDNAGNIYILNPSNRYVWKIDAITGIANIIAGGPTTTTSPRTGAYCNGGTSGPISADNLGDGCPGLETALVGLGTIPFDFSGNFYLASNGTYANGNLIVQKFSYNNQFPATQDGVGATQPLAFTAIASTRLTGRSFGLQGGTAGDYTDAGGTACLPATSLNALGLCVINVTFKPAHSGQRPGAIQLTTATGAAGSELLTGIGVASDIAIDNGTLSTLGANLTPSGIATDLLGNVYVADSKGNQVLKGAATGTVLTPLIAGLNNPSQIAIDNVGNIYIADTGNDRILVATSTGSTFAVLGMGLSGPKGVVVDGLGNIYVSDTGNNRILQLALNGNQLVFPLPGLTTALSAPAQLALDLSGNLYIFDSGNNRILEHVVSTGVTSQVALDATVVPTAFAIDFAGDIYVSDSVSKSVFDYYAGDTTGFGLAVGFSSPVGIAVDADGNLFVADTQMPGAIELRRSLGNIIFPTTTPGTVTQASITVNNVGTSSLNFQQPLASITSSALFAINPSTTNGCGAGVPFAPGASCNFVASFSPLAVGNATGVASFNTDASNATSAVANLNGVASLLNVHTTTTLSITPPTGIFYSEPVTLTATLTPDTLTVPLTGTFTLTVDGKTDEPPVSVGNGVVTFTLQLPIGTHQLTVTYSGGSPYASSTAAVTVPVNPAVTTTSLSVNPQTLSGVASLVFSASVMTTTAAGQTGTITIYAGTVSSGMVICTQPLSATYTVSCTSSTLNFPVNSFIAVYSGSTNGNFAVSTSAAVTPPAGSFVVGPVISSFTVPQGGVGQLNVDVTALYGSSGTVTPSCSGLPANSVCRFTPVTIALGSTPVPVLVQVYTDVSSTLASNKVPPIGHGSAFLAIGIPLLSLLLLRRRTRLFLLILFVLALSASSALSGCSGTQNLQLFPNLQTPTGTFPITLIFTGSNGLSTTQTTPATFTVLPAPSN